MAIFKHRACAITPGHGQVSRLVAALSSVHRCLPGHAVPAVDSRVHPRMFVAPALLGWSCASQRQSTSEGMMIPTSMLATASGTALSGGFDPQPFLVIDGASLAPLL